LSRGSSSSGYPIRLLVSFQINRQLSGWILPSTSDSRRWGARPKSDIPCFARRMYMANHLIEAYLAANRGRTRLKWGYSMSEVRNGGCLCGAIRYETRGRPQRVTVCHCTFCQRRTGGALSIHAWFNEEDVTLSGDDPGTYEHRSDESSNYLRLHFCKRCATTVMLALEKRPGFRLITGGTLDNPKSITVDCHVWRRSAQPWICLPDNVTSYETSSGASATTSG
jgi:hypothetical protein